MTPSSYVIHKKVIFHLVIIQYAELIIKQQQQQHHHPLIHSFFSNSFLFQAHQSPSIKPINRQASSPTIDKPIQSDHRQAHPVRPSTSLKVSLSIPPKKVA